MPTLTIGREGMTNENAFDQGKSTENMSGGGARTTAVLRKSKMSEGVD
jgi:hypothetical protein